MRYGQFFYFLYISAKQNTLDTILLFTSVLHECRINGVAPVRGQPKNGSLISHITVVGGTEDGVTFARPKALESEKRWLVTPNEKRKIVTPQKPITSRFAEEEPPRQTSTPIRSPLHFSAFGTTHRVGPQQLCHSDSA